MIGLRVERLIPTPHEVVHSSASHRSRTINVTWW